MTDSNDNNDHPAIFKTSDHPAIAEAIAPVAGMVSDHGLAAKARAVERSDFLQPGKNARGSLPAKFAKRLLDPPAYSID